MKINSIITRYLFWEMIPPFLLNMIFFTFIFLMTKLLEITNMAVNYQVSIVTVLKMLIYNMPLFMNYIIPMSVMMSILLTFLRLSSDNEIMAFKASGLTVSHFLPSVFLFCLLGALLTGWMSIYAQAWGQSAFRRLIYEAATSSIEVGLQERRFNDNFKGITLYVKQIDSRTKDIKGVFIEDRRKGNLVSAIVAPKARYYHAEGSPTFTFRLYNGAINHVNLIDDTNSYLKFETYDLKLNLLPSGKAKQNSDQKDEDEMTLTELLQYLDTADRSGKQYRVALAELHRKFVLPVACLILGILAVPFGIQSNQAKRSYGVLLGLIFFLIYYLLFSLGWTLSKTGVLAPAIGMWGPNILLGFAAIFFLTCSQKEKTLIIDQAIKAVWHWLVEHFSFLKKRFSNPKYQG